MADVQEPTEGTVPPLKVVMRVLAPYARPHLWVLGLALFFTLAGSMAALLMPQVLRGLIDGPIAEGTRSALLPATLVVLGLGLFEAAMVFVRRMMVLGACTQIETKARMALFTHLLDLPSAFHDRWPSGQLLTRVTQDLNLVRRWLAFGLIMLINDIGMLVIGVILMARSNLILALMFLAGAVPLIILVARFEQVYRKLTRRAQDKAGDVATATIGDVGAFEAPTAEAAARAVDASPIEEGRQVHDLVLQLDAQAPGYPIVLISYALVCQQYREPATAALVKDYFGWVASAEGQQASADGAGAAPLSPALGEKVVAAVESIR